MSAARAAIAEICGAEVAAIERMAGGDLDGAVRVRLADGREVVAKQGPLVAREARMLHAIRETGAPAPEVFGVRGDLLLIELLPADGNPSDATWASLAAALELLHDAAGDAYGWPEDYAFREVAIPNGQSTSWPEFWATSRLLNHGPHIPPSLARRVERLTEDLANRLPERPRASLLHGDLWGGNILLSRGSVSGLIDPACYHGDREVDFAMLSLFDRPPEAFFERAALEPGWRERRDIYRLWPLLVHLRLFGHSYFGSVSACLGRLGV
jgi:fructosamine-3-kinase